MNISVPIPLDDGFIRRECPNCEREFKWFTEETEDRPEGAVDPEVYFCPYCGVAAPPDQWWTSAQLEYARDAAMAPVSDMVNDELKKIARRSSGSLIKFDVKPGARPPAPLPLAEPADMVIVEPPCHPYEPLKIAEGWDAPLHCLICGSAFTI